MIKKNQNGERFDSNQAVKNEIIQFFVSKNQTFYESGIMKLTKRWQKVIEQNGQYIIFLTSAEQLWQYRLHFSNVCP